MGKQIHLDLGNVSQAVRPMSFVPPSDPVPGYYIDTETGIRYYYDGVQWFQINGVLFIPLGIITALGITDTQWTGVKTSISPGDTVTISVTYNYAGPAISNAVQHFEIGFYQLGLWETGVAATPQYMNHAAAASPVLVSVSMSLVIPASFDDKYNDVLFKIVGGTPTPIAETGVRHFDRVELLSNTPTITNVTITSLVKV